MTTADVLDRLAAWAEDGSGFWNGGGSYNPENREQVCVVATLIEIFDRCPLDGWLGAHDALGDAARVLGYFCPSDCNDRGGLPAVRRMIALAREGATDDR